MQGRRLTQQIWLTVWRARAVTSAFPRTRHPPLSHATSPCLALMMRPALPSPVVLPLRPISAARSRFQVQCLLLQVLHPAIQPCCATGDSDPNFRQQNWKASGQAARSTSPATPLTLLSRPLAGRKYR